jgi:hypothetical protein
MVSLYGESAHSDAMCGAILAGAQVRSNAMVVNETENEGFLLINGNTADLLIEEINKAISLNISMQNPSTLGS